LIIQGLIDVGGLHIGSVAVLGLDPKPIIDLDAVVADQLGVAPATRALVAAGWLHEGDLGVRGREPLRPPPGEIYHLLYVLTEGNQAHRDHLDLGDFLRGHTAEAAQYAALQHHLAPLLATDRAVATSASHGIPELTREASAAYTNAKADLIAELLNLTPQVDRQLHAPTTCGMTVRASAACPCRTRGARFAVISSHCLRCA
jgi:GrpB-like predicted nucleotidyltransferase (UPF0157 family)